MPTYKTAHKSKKPQPKMCVTRGLRMVWKHVRAVFYAQIGSLELNEATTDDINFCVDIVVPKKTIRWCVT